MKDEEKKYYFTNVSIFIVDFYTHTTQSYLSTCFKCTLLIETLFTLLQDTAWQNQEALVLFFLQSIWGMNDIETLAGA